MIYTDLTTALVILAEENDAFGVYTFVNSPDFAAYLPRIIERAELRCYREICPLAARAAPATGQTVAGQRTLPLAALNPLPIVIEGIALITPAGSAPAAGTRWQYRKASLDFIDTYWPTEATTKAPAAADPELYFAYKDALNLVLAPTPDLVYFAETIGTVIPTPISMGNPSTYLSINYPDQFLTACAIETAGYMRDYSSQGDDPKVALTWEARYQEGKAAGIEEERRRRGVNAAAVSGPASAAYPPPSQTQPQRGP